MQAELKDNDQNLGVGWWTSTSPASVGAPVTSCNLQEHLQFANRLVSGKTTVSLSSVSPSTAKREW